MSCDSAADGLARGDSGSVDEFVMVSSSQAPSTEAELEMEPVHVQCTADAILAHPDLQPLVPGMLDVLPGPGQDSVVLRRTTVTVWESLANMAGEGLGVYLIEDTVTITGLLPNHVARMLTSEDRDDPAPQRTLHRALGDVLILAEYRTERFRITTHAHRDHVVWDEREEVVGHPVFFGMDAAKLLAARPSLLPLKCRAGVDCELVLTPPVLPAE